MGEEKKAFLLSFFCACFSPAFPTTDRLRGFALRPLWIPHQGDRIRTYGPLYPKQMRWPDCATPRLPPRTYGSTRSIKTRTAVAHPALGTGGREPPLLGKKPTILFHLHFLSWRLALVLLTSFPFFFRIVFVATTVLPVCLSPIMNSRWPRPMGIIESIAISPVWRGSYTERLEILPGAGDSIKRDSEATISPLPSIGLARAFITRPK